VIDEFLPKLEELVERSKGKIRADKAHEHITAMGYAGSERTTRRAVAALKAAWQAGRRRVHRPWIPEPGMWAHYDFGDGPLAGGAATILFCWWLAWSRFRVVLPLLDKSAPSVWAAVDVALRRAGGVPGPRDRLLRKADLPVPSHAKGILMSAERECVSSEELIEILNLELAKHGECADCQFVGPIRQLTTPYADGGNWFRSLTVRGRPQDPHVCGETAADVVVLVAQHYDLALHQQLLGKRLHGGLFTGVSGLITILVE
jgi:hypothetical protein